MDSPSSSTSGGRAVDGTGIVGVIWLWQGAQAPNQEHTLVVPDPESYRLHLRPNGRFDFRADCNVGSGSYHVDEGLRFEFGAITMAECGPASLFGDYMRLLGDVETQSRDGDDLRLGLKAYSGNMRFTRLHAVTGRVVSKEGVSVPDGATLEIKVMDVSLADAVATQMGGQTIYHLARLPARFEASYNARAIQPRHSYALSVRIVDSAGRLLFINTGAYDVLTRGKPSYEVEVWVDRVAPQPASSNDR